ncbi:uracil permease [Basidiobolus ranarum]|uniref:Uracil permease n=1 Tax=Basidiobolus ranarum TaxID=34480 RepID=A0ABR2VT27_9FUNG
MERLKNFMEIKRSDGDVEHENNRYWSEDMAPLPEERQTWDLLNFVSFWISDAFNIPKFLMAGSLVSLGMNWWQAMLTFMTGMLVITVAITFAGVTGARYHVSFPVVGRLSFGMKGAYIPVCMRFVLAWIWYGVNLWLGGECLYVVILAVWPGYNNIDKGFSDPDIHMKQFIPCIVFWLASIPVIALGAEKIRPLFMVKAFFLPIAGIVLFVWSVVNAGGFSSVLAMAGTNVESKEPFFWAFFSGVTSVMGNMATFAINCPDYTRYSKTVRAQTLGQAITIPLSMFFTGFLAVFISSASITLYNEAIWDPIVFISKMDPSSTLNRVLQFILGLGFCLALLVVNCAGNALFAGNDISSLAPRYMTIRRGSILCAVVGICICPWKLLSGANGFLNFLSSYTTFLGPIGGVVIADYWIVRKRYVEVSELYKPGGIYWYSNGFHMPALVALVIGIIPNFPGFLNKIGVQGIPDFFQKVFNFSWFIGFLLGGFVYVMICQFHGKSREEIVSAPRVDVEAPVDEKKFATITY